MPGIFRHLWQRVISPTDLNWWICSRLLAEWKQFAIERNFRGARYRVTVENPDGVGRGVALDRDKNYDKVKRAYDAMVDGAGTRYE